MGIFDGNRSNIFWNGIDLGQFYNLYVLDLDVTSESKFGVTKTITYGQDGSFIKCDGDRFIINVNFIRLVNGVPKALDEKYMEQLSKIFFRENNKEKITTMNIACRLYYVIPLEGSIKKLKTGYFTITVESVSPYCFSLPRFDHYRRIKDRVIETELNNKGITDVFTDIEFKGSAEKIVITNKTNGNYIEIDDVVDVDVNINGDTLEVTGLDYNKVQGNVRETLRMSYGVNRYSIEVVGEIEFQFIHQCQMGLK